MKALDIAIYLIVLAALAGATWTARGLWRTLRADDYRTRNDRKQAAWLAVCTPRTEPAEPGTNDELLDACQQICPDLARKEMP
ncbi:hypothetical protein TUSST3_08690 [Streptomyces sp. TUS-ST3]|uniref:hypothetical protein n=1 Tax=Streptomyces sp. TUS-ST3 TaxID=3025591 RepID=UPI0024E141E5|nr:hypothetical protein [Streptomyces sp. TUS-ST3]GLP64249.1 hypothetical protein TUSST3_08690 [Streptomyces sp. TUS-ST3]